MSWQCYASNNIQYITSANYPAVYPYHQSDCQWGIKASYGNVVYFAFETFQLNSNNANCTVDYAELSENITKTKQSIIANACLKSGLNKTYHSYRANMNVKLHSDKIKKYKFSYKQGELLPHLV